MESIKQVAIRVQCPVCQGYGSVMSQASAAALMAGECVNPEDVDCPRCHRDGTVEIHVECTCPPSLLCPAHGDARDSSVLGTSVLR